MSDLFRRYATPFITGLFLVSLISGVALFFHVGQSYFRGMHEWLSLVLVLPFVLHIWKNWRPMTLYLGRAPFSVAMALSLAGALAFAWPALTGAEGGAGGPPVFALAHKVMAQSPSVVAPLLGTTADQLLTDLRAKGFTIENAEQKFTDIATKSGKDEMGLAAALIAASK